MFRSLSATDPVTATWLLVLLTLVTVVAVVPLLRLLAAAVLYAVGRGTGRAHLIATARRVMPRVAHLLGGLVIGVAAVAAPASAVPSDPSVEIGSIALDRNGATDANTAPVTTPKATTASTDIALDRGPTSPSPEGAERASAATRASRAVTAPSAAEDTRTDTIYVVRTGDTLWGIAAEQLDHPSNAAITDGWRAIWRANRTVIGEHPERIFPGQVLHLDGLLP